MAYYLIGDSGTVVFERFAAIVDSEAVTRTSKVTTNPVESGSPITDHAIPQPVKLDVQATLAEPDGLDILKAMWANRDLLRYRGADTYDDMIITSLAVTRNKSTGPEGCTVRMSMTQVTLTAPTMTAITGPVMSGTDKAKKSTKPAKSTASTGLVTIDSDYASYVDSYNDSNAGGVTTVNTDITPARDNKWYRGYRDGTQ